MKFSMPKLQIKNIKITKQQILFVVLLLLFFLNLKGLFTEKIENLIQTFFQEYFIETKQETNKGGPHVIRVGVHNDIPGMGEYNEETDTYYGMEIEIAKELAYKMNYKKIHFIPVNTENRVEALKTNKVDFVIATCTIEKNPPHDIVYSEPYLNTHSKILTLDSSMFYKLIDLNNEEMGIIKNSANKKQARDYLYKRKIKPIFESYDTYDDLFEALVEGKVDSITLDEKMMGKYVELYPTISYAININYLKFDYGIMIEKDNPLEKKINSTLQEIKKDGTLQSIIDKWDEK